MKIKKTGAKYSAIVGIGEKIAKLEEETGRKILKLNRGVPSVENIDISEVTKSIDFNSTDVLVYPPNSGLPGVKNAINSSFFGGAVHVDNLFVTAGGMNALDLVLKTIDVEGLALSKYYWGAYLNIMKTYDIPATSYESYDYLYENAADYKGKAVIICDPNNPVGDKYDDDELLKVIARLSDSGAIVIWDSPYRALFYNDSVEFLQKIIKNPKVIVTESFSKSLGLSGERIGFVYSGNKEFNEQFGINLLYVTNGINGFAQILVEKLLTTDAGKKAADRFRLKTREDIKKNIDYLRENGFLAESFYEKSVPMGIFVVLNRSSEYFMEHEIATVPMAYFTVTDKVAAEKYSRACISIPHNELKEYFDKIK